jgi:hypothetical protein
MDFVTALLGWIVAALGLVLGVLWWIVSYLLWGFVWLLLPLAIVAVLALRIAEKILGPDVVRAWVKARAMKFGTGTWDRVRPWLFALGVAPFRVLLWFPVYALWHAAVSLFWKPRWSPWQRAWGKRWRDGQRPTAANLSAKK